MQLLAADSVNDVANNIREILVGVSTTVAIIALIILGIRMLLSMKRGDGMREAFQGFGMIALAALIIGGAGGLATMLISVGEQVGG